MANYTLSPKGMLDQMTSLLRELMLMFEIARCGEIAREDERVSAPPSITADNDDSSEDGAATHAAGSPSDSRGRRLAAAAAAPAPRTAPVAAGSSPDETSAAATSSAATAAVSAQQAPRAAKRAHVVDEEAGSGAPASSKRARSNNDDSPDGAGGVKRTRIWWSPEQEVALIMGASVYGVTRSWAKILCDPWLQPALTRDGSARSNKDLKDKFRNLILKHGVDKLVRDGKLAWDVLYARVPSAVHGASLPLPSEIAAFNAGGARNAGATAPMEAPGALANGAMALAADVGVNNDSDVEDDI